MIPGRKDIFVVTAFSEVRYVDCPDTTEDMSFIVQREIFELITNKKIQVNLETVTAQTPIMSLSKLDYFLIEEKKSAECSSQSVNFACIELLGSNTCSRARDAITLKPYC